MVDGCFPVIMPSVEAVHEAVPTRAIGSDGWLSVGFEIDDDCVRACVGPESGLRTSPQTAGFPLDCPVAMSDAEGVGKSPDNATVPVSGRIPATWKKLAVLVFPADETVVIPTAPTERAVLSKAAKVVGNNPDAAILNLFPSSFSRSHRGVPAE